MAIRLTLADDTVIFLQGLVSLLAAETDLLLLGQSQNGEEAWQQIQTLRPDVAVADMRMPGLSGLDIAQRLKQQGEASDTRLIILTMYNDHWLAVEAVEAGVAGYILKDNTFDELVQGIRTVAAGGRFITPAIEEYLIAEGLLGPEGTVGDSQARFLSRREEEVLKMTVAGLNCREIADHLGISPRSVETYRRRMMQKRHLETMADMVRYALMTGLIK